MTPYQIPGLMLANHYFNCPLDYSEPDGETIQVFVREVVSPSKQSADLPYLLFLQGGPGHPSPRPEESSGWLKRALEEYRVLFLDQRGTGLSTPLHFQTLAGYSAQEAADYLMHFRADSIVQDAELIRKQLLGEDVQWSLLGQSYGGFCISTYLSFAPEGVREAIFTGGLPPIGQPVDEVYRATFKRVIAQNKLFYKRYPEDIERVKEVIDYLQNNDVRMPTGGVLTVRRFQQLGLMLGGGNGHETLHYMLEEAFVETKSGKELNFTFLNKIEAQQSFETNPIFALLHEAIYCEGDVSNWSAERVQSEFDQFSNDPNEPFFFTGEMIYSWMFDEYEGLKPLKETADILARFSDWAPLYNVEQLRKNTVPCVAVVYYDDMYVEREFSEITGNMLGANMWITNEYNHSGLRTSGEKVLDRLLNMLHGNL
ncbi:MAG: alpha/beta fold hydrolase [Anaerolineae bacterium]